MSTYDIKTTMSIQAISDLFTDCGRGESFTHEGLIIVMDDLEQSSTDGTIDLDVIAICGEYSEVTAENFINDWDHLVDGFIEDDEDKLEATVEAYQNHYGFARVCDYKEIVVYRNS